MVKDTKNEKTKKKWGRKILKWLFGGILGLIILIIGGVYYIYNYYDWKSVVRNLVHEQGTAVVGTDVNIGSINLSLTNGNGSIGNITVANPQGYSQDYIIKLGEVAVSVDKDSIIRLAKETAQKSGPKVKTVIINEIRVDKPEVAYELMNFNKNNVDDILANIKKNTASAKQPQKTENKSDVEYKVAIKKVIVANGTATVAANLLGASQSLSLNLPTITINNLGTEKQGITIEDGLARIFQEILKTTTSAVSQADLSSVLGGVGNLTGAATDTAGKAAEAVTEGASKGVKNLTDSVGKLF